MLQYARNCTGLNVSDKYIGGKFKLRRGRHFRAAGEGPEGALKPPWLPQRRPVESQALCVFMSVCAVCVVVRVLCVRALGNRAEEPGLCHIPQQ